MADGLTLTTAKQVENVLPLGKCTSPFGSAPGDRIRQGLAAKEGSQDPR